jgi:hypothetical protein
MKRKVLFLLLIAFLACRTAVAQYKIVIAKEPSPQVFDFTKHWDYPWYITKDDGGKFSNAEGDTITSKDTLRQYFTARCKTNVQGGYEIRYCTASRNDEGINLCFADGPPAYGSDYVVGIKKGKCTFKPNVVYPELIPAQKITYTTTACHLTLYQQDYAQSKTISGYINAKFTEILFDKHNKKITRNYFLTGYFKTPVKS